MKIITFLFLIIFTLVARADSMGSINDNVMAPTQTGDVAARIQFLKADIAEKKAIIQHDRLTSAQNGTVCHHEAYDRIIAADQAELNSLTKIKH